MFSLYSLPQMMLNVLQVLTHQYSVCMSHGPRWNCKMWARMITNKLLVQDMDSFLYLSNIHSSGWNRQSDISRYIGLASSVYSMTLYGVTDAYQCQWNSAYITHSFRLFVICIRNTVFLSTDTKSPTVWSYLCLHDSTSYCSQRPE